MPDLSGATLQPASPFTRSVLEFEVRPGTGTTNGEYPVEQPIDPTGPEYLGNVDRVSGHCVEGWAISKRDPRRRLVVEVWADDAFVAAGEASLPRGDLIEAGIGDGHSMFRILLPGGLADGKEHLVVCKVSGTNHTLDETLVFQAEVRPVEAALEVLEGLTLKGWVLLPVGQAMDLDVQADGVFVTSVFVPPDFTGNRVSLAIALPVTLADGNVHWFQLRVRDTGIQIAAFAGVTAITLTPETALQTYAKSFPAFLSSQAARRYRSLEVQIGQLAKLADLANLAASPQPVQMRLEQLALAHRQVTRGIADQGRLPETLIFPAYAKPDVSVVVPVFNKFWVTYNCLAALLLAPNTLSFEVIVVDDASSDMTTRLEEFVQGITVLRNETGLGFVRSSNRGGKAARGDLIVMLNNDTEVCANWIDELASVFDAFPDVGMSGAKFVYSDGTLQEAGGIIFPNLDAWNYGRNCNPHDSRFNYVRQIDYVSGACIMLRKPIWDELGGFDELFAPAYYEDTDLAFRVRARGLKTFYTPFATVIHFEGVSSGTSLTSGVKRHQAINQPKFRSRWAATLRHYPGTQDPELAKDRGIQLRALVIDHQVPQPDKDAGSFAAVQEMRLLQALGFKLTFVPVNMAYLGNYTEAMQRRGIECLYAPFQTSVEEVIDKRGTEFDLVYITRYSIADRFIDRIRHVAPQAKIVFNDADLHFLREIRAALANDDRAALGRAVHTRDVELSVMRRTDLTLTYTETEAAVILSHNLDSTKVARCPWVVEVDPAVPTFAARKGLAFLGNYNHPPNLQAVKFFVDEVLPLLRRRMPDVTFDIYGSHVPKELRDLEAEGVQVKGWVEDVAEVYHSCRIFVAPLRSGAGIKGKVIGALAAGTPVVMSPLAAEGVGISRGSEAMVAETVDEWVQAIVALYHDGDRWAAMSRRAQDYAERSFSFENGLVMMRQALGLAGVYVG